MSQINYMLPKVPSCYHDMPACAWGDTIYDVLSHCDVVPIPTSMVMLPEDPVSYICAVVRLMRVELQSFYEESNIDTITRVRENMRDCAVPKGIFSGGVVREVGNTRWEIR